MQSPTTRLLPDAELRTLLHMLKQPGLARLSAVLSVSTTLEACTNGTQISFLNPQGPIAAIQRTHFVEMLSVLILFVALPIFILIPLIAWRYRYRATRPRYMPRWGYSNMLEMAAWTGPAIIVALLATLVWRSTHALDPYRPIASNAPPLHIFVVGFDWKWLFIYPDQCIASIGVMPLPVGRPVALELTSATVMQSFQIPALGSQIYAMGGMVTQLHLRADATGRFMGENTMYNGDGFHQQRFTAIAMTPEAFNAWVSHSQSAGLPLNTANLRLIARQTTAAQLEKDLDEKADKGAILFNQAEPDLFPRIVMATKGEWTPTGGQSSLPSRCGADSVQGATVTSKDQKP